MIPHLATIFTPLKHSHISYTYSYLQTPNIIPEHIWIQTNYIKILFSQQKIYPTDSVYMQEGTK